MAFQLLRFVHGRSGRRTHDMKSFRPIWISAVPDSRQANVVFQELLQFSLLLMQLATQHKNEEHVHVVAAILALVDAMELHIQMLLATQATGNMKVLQQQFYKCMAKIDAMDLQFSRQPTAPAASANEFWSSGEATSGCCFDVLW